MKGHQRAGKEYQHKPSITGSLHCIDRESKVWLVIKIIGNLTLPLPIYNKRGTCHLRTHSLICYYFESLLVSCAFDWMNEWRAHHLVLGEEVERCRGRFLVLIEPQLMMMVMVGQEGRGINHGLLVLTFSRAGISVGWPETRMGELLPTRSIVRPEEMKMKWRWGLYILHTDSDAALILQGR